MSPPILTHPFSPAQRLSPEEDHLRLGHHLVRHPGRRGTFTSVAELVEAIMSYMNEHNANPKSFTWTDKADNILAKVERARAVLHNVVSA